MPRDLQSIVDELSRLLGSVATLEDKDFNLVTFSSQTSDVDPIRQHSILRRTSSEHVRSWFEQFGIATADGPVRTPADPDAGIVARLCLPARWRGLNHGYFWFLDENGDIDDTLLPDALSIAAQAGAALAQQWHARQDVQSNVEALLGTDLDLVDQAAEELESLDVIRPGAPVVAVVCSVDAAADLAPINTWRLPPQVLVAPAVDGALSAVVPLRSPDDPSPGTDAASHLRDLVWGSLEGGRPGVGVGSGVGRGVGVGIGGARRNLRQVRGSWLEARLAATVAREEPRFPAVARWDELGVHRLLACGPRTALREAVLDPAVVRLIEHGSDDLVTTAATFLDSAGSVQRTAAALQIHRQTLYYRLRRIEEVTGLDLELGQHRLVLHLGLTLTGSLG